MLLALAATAATAASARADALGLIVAGEPAKQPIIEGTLEPWLAQRGYQVKLRVSDAKVADKLVDCFIITDQRCGESAVATLNLPSTLFVMVEVHHDTKANADEVKLTGWLYGARGLSIASQSVFCRACKNDTLGPTVEDLAKALFAVAGEGTGRLRITSEPTGASVTIDGTKVGATPWEQGVLTGAHTVTVEHPGHRPETRQVDVTKDATVPVEIQLVSIAPPPPPPGRAKWPLAIAGAGAAALITGVVFVVLDEDCDTTAACDAKTDKKVLDSAGFGYGLIAAGVVGAGVGTLLYLRSGKPATTTPTAWIDPGRGGGIGMIGRF